MTLTGGSSTSCPPYFAGRAFSPSCVLFPLKELMQAFTAYREASVRQLSYNAFEIYLQKWLNDVFFYEYDEIYITDEVLPVAYL